MQSMSCEPLDDGLLEEMDIYFGTPTRAVQVEVGEGMQDGETWWVVVMDSPPDDSYQWGLRAFLTNAPGVEHVDQWVWIPIDLDSDDPWENVSWDTERTRPGAGRRSPSPSKDWTHPSAYRVRRSAGYSAA